MRDLLLDVNIVVDVCSARRPWYIDSTEAMARCLDKGGRVWLYSGSVQTYEYTLAKEIFMENQEKGVSFANSLAAARDVLAVFCNDKHWLAALAGEGMVFEAEDPEDEQLIRALDRFPEGSIKFLTRDKGVLKKYPELTVSPERYLDETVIAKPTAFVDLAAQQDEIRPALEKNVHTVLSHGRYILGPEVRELEEKLAGFAGAKHCIGCSSGTDALLMSLMALDVGPGDAVFTTPFTFVATADVIARLGATPVFVDIDPRTYNIDPDKLDQAIQAITNGDYANYPVPRSSNTSIAESLNPKCVIPVDLYGLPCDYEAINAAARKYGLSVIQDGAQSFGAEYQGRLCPVLGDIGCTSFFPSKPLGGYGDGGALFTDNDDLADKLKSIRVHGQGASKYDTVRLGLKGRMDTLQAAIVLPKLDIYPRELELRRQAAEHYNQLLSSTSLTHSPGSMLHAPCVPEGYKSAWALYTVLAMDSEQRSDLQSRLKEAGIPSVVYYGRPLHMQPVFEPLGYKQGDFPVAETSAERVLSLPMHPYLTREEQDRICRCLSGRLGA